MKHPSQMTPKELKDAVRAEVDASTTPLVMFTTAKAYHVAAHALMNKGAPRMIGHWEAPILALFHHAAELYLKAFLLEAGMTPAQLRGRDAGHNYDG